MQKMKEMPWTFRTQIIRRVRRVNGTAQAAKSIGFSPAPTSNEMHAHLVVQQEAEGQQEEGGMWRIPPLFHAAKEIRS